MRDTNRFSMDAMRCAVTTPHLKERRRVGRLNPTQFLGGDNVRTYGKLKEKIKLIFGTQEAFAKAMGMAFTTANKKLNNKSEWTYGELEKICDLFGMEMSEIKD